MGKPSILTAVEAEKDANHVQSLIRQGADVNERGGSGMTALSFAARQGRLDVVETLLKAKADPNIADGDGWTPLHHLVFRTQPDIKLQREICLKLIQGGADPNFKSKEGETPLLASCPKGPRMVWIVLLDNGADVNAVNNQGSSAVHIASTSGREENDIKTLVMGGGKMIRKLDRLEGQKLLHEYKFIVTASERGDLEEVRSLAQLTPNFPSPNMPQPYLDSALHGAARHGHAEIIEVLVRSGASLEVQDDEGQIPIRIATQNGHDMAVHTLLSLGAKVGGTDALHVAASLHKVNMIALFLNKGGKINSLDPRGRTPLMCAIEQVEVERGTTDAKQEGDSMVKHLIELGADVNMQDKGGQTALFYLAGILPCPLSTFNILMDAGAKLSIRDNRGRSCCHASKSSAFRGFVEEWQAKTGDKTDVETLEKKDDDAVDSRYVVKKRSFVRRPIVTVEDVDGGSGSSVTTSSACIVGSSIGVSASGSGTLSVSSMDDSSWLGDDDDEPEPVVSPRSIKPQGSRRVIPTRRTPSRTQDSASALTPSEDSSGDNTCQEASNEQKEKDTDLVETDDDVAGDTNNGEEKADTDEGSKVERASEAAKSRRRKKKKRGDGTKKKKKEYTDEEKERRRRKRKEAEEGLTEEEKEERRRKRREKKERRARELAEKQAKEGDEEFLTTSEKGTEPARKKTGNVLLPSSKSTSEVSSRAAAGQSWCAVKSEANLLRSTGAPRRQILGSHVGAPLSRKESPGGAAEDWNSKLQFAISKGSEEETIEALKKGADINASLHEDLGTALHIAAWFGHEHIVHLLLENGANAAATNRDELTASDIADMQEHKDINILLMKKMLESPNKVVPLEEEKRDTAKYKLRMSLKKSGHLLHPPEKA